MKKKLTPKLDSIIIEGDKKFTTQTIKALGVLKRKTPRVYNDFILKFVRKIKLYKTSGMNLFAKTPTFEVSSKTAFKSLKWYASVIAHEAYHSKLYFEYNKKNKKEVPREVYASQKAEIKCIRYQIKIGRKIGLSSADIKYIKSLDGSHSNLSQINW